MATPLEGMVTRKALPAAGPSPSMVRLRCDVHPWMSAWVLLFDHPIYTQVGADGRYRLGPVPSGAHKVRFWHPTLGQQVRDVKVPEGAGASLDLGF